MDQFIQKSLEEVNQFIFAVKKNSNLDEFTIHILIEFYIKSITEFIKHDIPYETAIKEFANINTFFFAGWKELMK